MTLQCIEVESSMDLTQIISTNRDIPSCIKKFWLLIKLLGYDVNKICKILIKTLNVTEYIKSDIQTIETPKPNDLIF